MKLGALAVLCVAACAATPAQRPPSSRQANLREPERLSAVARSLIRERMQRHADQMTWLVMSTVLLDYPSAEDAAHEVATEARLARPLPAERDTLNASLPARFFDLEEDLARRAQVVLAAARAADPQALRQAVGGLTETCVACHASYLDDEAERTP